MCLALLGWIQYLHGLTWTQADVKFLHALLDNRNVAVPSCFPYEPKLKTKTRLLARIGWRQSIRAAAAPAVGRYVRARGLSQAGVCAVRCWQWVSAGRRWDSSAQSGQRLGSGVTVGSVHWFLSHCLGCRSWTAMKTRGVWVGDGSSSAAGLMFDLLQQFSSHTQLRSLALGFRQSFYVLIKITFKFCPCFVMSYSWF